MAQNRTIFAEQPEVLAERLRQAGVQHGETVKVRVPEVAVYPAGERYDKPTVQFCMAGKITVLQRKGTPDGGEISSEVTFPTFKGRDLPKFYGVVELIVSTNGSTAVMSMKRVAEPA